MNKKPPVRSKMVAWYSPAQLAQTAVEVVLSTIFGRHADHRLHEALASPKIEPYEYAVPEDQPFWLDYVSDVGDGWDSTYAVAYTLAQPTLEVSGHKTRRGAVLVFGGDEVYPIASRKEYEDRLVGPYQTALRESNPESSAPHAFAVPGNHDWYDSLVSFTRLFVNKKWLGGWKCPQHRSYFALKLPHGWWLLGTDVQLDSDIDEPQVKYFESIRDNEFREGDRVILCNAEPHWIYEAAYQDDDDTYSQRNLAFLEEKVLKRSVSVFLAGDLHHYRRHATPDGRQKITAGGGGAFLHPTHGAKVDQLAGGYTFQKSFPDPATSRSLTWGNLLFPLRNPWFGMLTAVAYLLTSWSVMAPIWGLGLGQIGAAINLTLKSILSNPQAAFWVLALFAGFWLFTDTHKKSYRLFAGLIHSLAHIAATFFLGWGVSSYCFTGSDIHNQSVAQLLGAGALTLLGGYVIGPCIFGLYLLISLNVFGRHQNEAFSSLAIRDWKSFLRLRIDPDGELTIFPIGLRRVPRKWKDREGAAGPELVPDDPQATGAELIEDPIQVHHR